MRERSANSWNSRVEVFKRRMIVVKLTIKQQTTHAFDVELGKVTDGNPAFQIPNEYEDTTLY
jgi:hypothetical protein